MYNNMTVTLKLQQDAIRLSPVTSRSGPKCPPQSIGSQRGFCESYVKIGKL